MYNWSNVAIKDIRMQELAEIEVGVSYHVEADIFLGELQPDDVLVETYYGRVDSENQFTDRFTQSMEPPEGAKDRIFRYHCDVRFEEAGHFGLNIRITPNHPNSRSRHAMGLVIWGQA